MILDEEYTDVHCAFLKKFYSIDLNFLPKNIRGKCKLGYTTFWFRH